MLTAMYYLHKGREYGHKKITYNANQGVINPAYMGIVVEPPDDDFQIEKIAPAPKAIQKIHDMVIGAISLTQI